MNRFFVDQENIDDDRIRIDGEDVKHIKNVLRLREGENIEIVSGGLVYISEIIDLGSNYVDCKAMDSFEGRNESNIDIHLYQAIAKGSKMDFILQKATEIGVKKIYPIETSRTVVKLKGDKKIKSRLDRWQQISLEASKQSKREEVPTVEGIMDIDDLCQHLKDSRFAVLAYEQEDSRSFKEGLKDFDSSQPIHIIIGPEGGFDIEEVDKLRAVGVRPVTLGPRILRTETAGIVASTMALYEYGDLGVR